jgi:two-component system, NarL family, response regulator NreC
VIRVLLADDHETVRAGLRLLVDAQPDMQVIAEASNGEDALVRIREDAPDVAVLDLTMPGLGGLGVVRTLGGGPGAAALVVLTRHNDEAYVRELFAAGVSGYVLKQSPSDALLQAVRAAARGERYVDAAFDTPHDPERAVQGSTATAREREVLRLMAVGHSNKEIASRLGISVKTVEVHKANAMRKLHLDGRTDVIRYAVLNGWMKDP